MSTLNNISRGPMVDILKPGEVGKAKLDVYHVSKFDCMMSTLNGRVFEYCPEGEFLRLTVNGRKMMSDTPMEIKTNWEVMHYARGRVLIAGLGMGTILPSILSSDSVSAVVIVELSADVIALIEPQLRSLPGADKLSIIRGDIREWRPTKGTKFDTIYFDIWPDICTDNLTEVAKLHQAFKHYKAAGGWMDSWMADYLRSERNADRRRELAWGY